MRYIIDISCLDVYAYGVGTRLDFITSFHLQFDGLLINYLGLRGHVSGVCEQLQWWLGQVLMFSRVYIEQQLSFE